MSKANTVIRTEPYPKGIEEQYKREDEDSNQQIDWTDEYQRYCGKHDRSFHIKCRGCHPQ